MKTKWTAAVAAGAILIVLSSQAMAQPGNGRGRGFGRGQGMGRWAQGPTEVGQRAEPNGAGTQCPFGFAPRGRESRIGPGMGQPGFGRQFGRRLGLTDEQMEKIHAIVRDARSRTLAAIKGVLTDEQAKQLEQMCPRAGQSDRPGRGPAMRNDFVGPRGRRFEQGQGFGPRTERGPRWGRRPAGPEENRMMPPADQRSDEMDANRGPRMGRGPRWDARPDAARNRPVGSGESRMMPPIERQFDQIDANHDGALTREEIRAFHEKMVPGRGWEEP